MKGGELGRKTWLLLLSAFFGFWQEGTPVCKTGMGKTLIQKSCSVVKEPKCSIGVEIYLLKSVCVDPGKNRTRKWKRRRHVYKCRSHIWLTPGSSVRKADTKQLSYSETSELRFELLTTFRTERLCSFSPSK